MWIVHYQIREAPRLQSGVGIAILGWVVLIPAWIAVYFLLVRWPTLLIALFVLIWSADILAFFGGRALGRRRLASRISPGKTWEGFILGCLVFSVAGGCAVFAMFGERMPLLTWPHVVMLGFVLGIIAVVGDLAESIVKRCLVRKDSGHMLPGIGGVLDLVDSILFTSPVLFFYLKAIS